MNMNECDFFGWALIVGVVFIKNEIEVLDHVHVKEHLVHSKYLDSI